MLTISLQMVSLRDLTDSVTELEDKVRPMKPSKARQNVSRCVRGISLSRSFTSFKLKMAFSSKSSSPRALVVHVRRSPSPTTVSHPTSLTDPQLITTIPGLNGTVPRGDEVENCKDYILNAGVQKPG
jgi:hypothetical protein